MKRSSSGDPKRPTTQAPGQALGYSLQTTRFLVHLLDANPDWTVSLEVFEDVGVETPKGDKTAEQVKSTLDGNPVSDHAVDLWKTFGNWVDSVTLGHLDPQTTQFILYVSQPKTGEIVKTFSEARSVAEARAALLKAKNKLWGPAPDFSLRSTVSEAIRPYVDKVFGADEDLVCGIIQHFHLETGSGSPQQDLKEKFLKLLVPEEMFDDMLRYAQGWVKLKIDTLLEQKMPATIAIKEFRAAMLGFIRKNDRRTILRTFASMPSSREVETDLRVRTYVRQLDIIEVDEDQKITAVRDFLRASVDRTQWSVQGLVQESSFDDLEANLERIWTTQKAKTDILLADRSAVKRGLYLYSECSSHQAKLEGLEVPPHFTPGSFHALADSEVIGWHPDYKDELKCVHGSRKT